MYRAVQPERFFFIKKKLIFSNERATSHMWFAIKYTVLRSVGLIQ